MSLEVSADQRAILDRTQAALPRDIGTEPLRGGSQLPSLFYHPNSSARVAALVLSAGFDVVNQRGPSAEKKVERAIQVLELVNGDDTTGRNYLEGLKNAAENAPDFLNLALDEVVPYLRGQMDDVPAPAKPKSAAVPMPRALESGESLPEERLSGSKPPPTPRRAPKKAAPPEPKAEPAEAPAAEAPAEAPAGGSGVGPSEEEAAAAAAAALAAMEAPYEEVVEDDEAPRFDPDKHLKPEDGRRRRQRRSRTPQGLERPRPDQLPDPRGDDEKSDDGSESESQPTSDKAASDKPASDKAASEKAAAEPLAAVSRGCDRSSIADAALAALRTLLQRASDIEADGPLRIEMTIGPDTRPSRGRGRRGGDRGNDRGDRGGDRGGDRDGDRGGDRGGDDRGGRSGGRRRRRRRG